MNKQEALMKIADIIIQRHMNGPEDGTDEEWSVYYESIFLRILEIIEAV